MNNSTDKRFVLVNVYSALKNLFFVLPHESGTAGLCKFNVDFQSFSKKSLDDSRIQLRNNLFWVIKHRSELRQLPFKVAEHYIYPTYWLYLTPYQSKNRQIQRTLIILEWKEYLIGRNFSYAISC
jgi:hypothetical protein